MRVIKAHFACDRCGMTREVQVNEDRAAEHGLSAVLPDSPAYWQIVRGPIGPHNDPDKLLCRECVEAWRQFFRPPLNEALDAEDRAFATQDATLAGLRAALRGEEMPQ